MANITRDQLIDMCRDVTCWFLMDTVGRNHVECMRWLQSVGVIPYLNESQFLCPVTKNPNHEMRIRNNEQLAGKYAYRCNTCRNEGRPYPEIALTSNTWLKGAHLDATKIIQIVYAWTSGMKVERLSMESRIHIETAIEWYKRCRIACARSPRPLMIGGAGHVVEVILSFHIYSINLTIIKIDEKHLVTRKYNRGRHLAAEQVLVWGAFDRETNQVILQRIPDKRHETILPLVAAFIAPHSTIHSDGAYRDREEDFIAMDMHMSYWVNHSNSTYAETVTDPLLGIILRNCLQYINLCER